MLARGAGDDQELHQLLVGIGQAAEQHHLRWQLRRDPQLELTVREAVALHADGLQARGFGQTCGGNVFVFQVQQHRSTRGVQVVAFVPERGSGASCAASSALQCAILRSPAPQMRKAP